MNINANRLISLALLAATMGGCDFNEDFCIRNGELVVWCDFAGITDIPPVPQDRHVIAFGADVPPGEGTTFTQDTLRWSLPQGDYRFLFYTGSYEVVDAGDYHEARLIADTDTVGGGGVYLGSTEVLLLGRFQRTSGIPEIPEGGDPPRRIRPKTERPAERVRQHSPSERAVWETLRCFHREIPCLP